MSIKQMKWFSFGAHASGFGGRVVRHATGNRSTEVRVHVEAEVFREDKIVIQMSARAKQVKPLGNLTCIEMGSWEYVLVILDCHTFQERTKIG